MVERSPEKAGVGGSTPSLATISFNSLRISLPENLGAIGHNNQARRSSPLSVSRRPVSNASRTDCKLKDKQRTSKTSRRFHLVVLGEQGKVVVRKKFSREVTRLHRKPRRAPLFDRQGKLRKAVAHANRRVALPTTQLMG